MKYRPIAETDNPFRMLQKIGEVQLVDDADAAIAATGQPNGSNLFVVEIFLKHGSTRVIVTREYIMLVEESVVVNWNKSHVFQPLYAEGHLFLCHHPRRGCDGYFGTLF